MKFLPQISLREILLVVFFVAFAVASLKTGGILASAMLGLAGLLVLAVAIIAFVGRHDVQAFAIGMLIPVVGYACVVFGVGSTELDPYEAKLPTSRLLRPAFQILTRKAWVHISNGEFIRYFDPKKDADLRGPGGGAFVNRSATGTGPAYSTISEWPDRATFMSVGHVLVALVLGYLGGKFAVTVRRQQRPLEPER